MSVHELLLRPTLPPADSDDRTREAIEPVLGDKSRQAVNNVDRVEEILRLVDEMRVDELIERFADDAIMELPFAPGRMTKEYVGKAAIGAFQRSVRDAFSDFAVTVDAVHATADPNVVVAEFHSTAVVRENGRPYCNRYVTFFTFDDSGRLARWREYYDAGVVVRAFSPRSS